MIYIAPRIARRIKPKMNMLHYGRAKVVACPVCGSQPSIACTRSDGKNGQVHRERVLAFEEKERA